MQVQKPDKKYQCNERSPNLAGSALCPLPYCLPQPWRPKIALAIGQVLPPTRVAGQDKPEFNYQTNQKVPDKAGQIVKYGNSGLRGYKPWTPGK